MTKQSFPPQSILRGMKSFAINIELQDKTDSVSEPLLRMALTNGLTDHGFTVITDKDSTVDALLRCWIGSYTATAYNSGQPALCVLCQSISVLSPVASQPYADLFIIWQETSYGTVMPNKLCTQAIENASRQLSNLTTTLLDIQR